MSLQGRSVDEWLDINNLSMYKEALEREGYDDLMVLVDLEESEIQALWTSCEIKPGHQARFRRLLHSHKDAIASGIPLPPTEDFNQPRPRILPVQAKVSVFDWLDKHNLSMYKAAMLEQGYDDLEVLVDLSEPEQEVLWRCCDVKVGHRARFKRLFQGCKDGNIMNLQSQQQPGPILAPAPMPCPFPQAPLSLAPPVTVAVAPVLVLSAETSTALPSTTTNLLSSINQGQGISNQNQVNGSQSIAHHAQPTVLNPPSNLLTSLPPSLPTNLPTNIPTNLPTNLPTSLPTNLPTSLPINLSSSQPNLPTSLPSHPTSVPTTPTRPSMRGSMSLPALPPGALGHVPLTVSPMLAPTMAAPTMVAVVAPAMGGIQLGAAPVLGRAPVPISSPTLAMLSPLGLQHHTYPEVPNYVPSPLSANARPVTSGDGAIESTGAIIYRAPPRHSNLTAALAATPRPRQPPDLVNEGSSSLADTSSGAPSGQPRVGNDGFVDVCDRGDLGRIVQQLQMQVRVLEEKLIQTDWVRQRSESISETSKLSGFASDDDSAHGSSLKFPKSLRKDSLSRASSASTALGDQGSYSRPDLVLLFASPLVFLNKGAYEPIENEVREIDWSADAEAVLGVLPPRKINVRVEVLGHLSLVETLCRAPRVLHVSCHGSHHKGEFALCFEGSNGTTELFDVARLRETLQAAYTLDPIDLVFISACHSYDAGRVFLQAGVPHVVTVQSSAMVQDGVATTFARYFYLNLMGGAPLDKAFKNAKRAVKSADGGRIQSCCCSHSHKPNCAWYLMSKSNPGLAHRVHTPLCEEPGCKHEPGCKWVREFAGRLGMSPIYDGRHLIVTGILPEHNHVDINRMLRKWGALSNFPQPTSQGAASDWSTECIELVRPWQPPSPPSPPTAPPSFPVDVVPASPAAHHGASSQKNVSPTALEKRAHVSPQQYHHGQRHKHAQNRRPEDRNYAFAKFKNAHCATTVLKNYQAFRARKELMQRTPASSPSTALALSPDEENFFIGPLQVCCCSHDVPHDESMKFMLLSQDEAKGARSSLEDIPSHSQGAVGNDRTLNSLPHLKVIFPQSRMKPGAPSVWRQLPVHRPPSFPLPFLGRNLDMFNLIRMLFPADNHRKGVRFMNVWGQPGVGKYAFVTATCQYLYDRSRNYGISDGVAFVNLEQCRQISEVWQQIAYTLGWREEVCNESDLQKQFECWNGILVLSGCDQPLSVLQNSLIDFLCNLVYSTKHHKTILITRDIILSRKGLDTFHLNPLSDLAAARLFMHFAGRYLPMGYSINPATLASHPLLTYIGRSPQSIRTVAPLLEKMDLEKLAVAVTKEPKHALNELPSKIHGEVLEHEPGLATCVQVCLEYLLANHQEAFHLLRLTSLFPAGLLDQDLDIVWFPQVKQEARWPDQMKVLLQSKAGENSFWLMQASVVANRKHYSTTSFVRQFIMKHYHGDEALRAKCYSRALSAFSELSQFVAEGFRSSHRFDVGESLPRTVSPDIGTYKVNRKLWTRSEAEAVWRVIENNLTSFMVVDTMKHVKRYYDIPDHIESITDSRHSPLGNLFINIANILRMNGRFSDCLELCKAGCIILKDTRTSIHARAPTPDPSTTNTNPENQSLIRANRALAELYCLKAQVLLDPLQVAMEAAPSFAQAKQMATEVVRDPNSKEADHIDYAKILVWCGVAMESHSLSDAAGFYEEAEKLFEQYGRDSLDRGRGLKCAGALHFKLAENSEDANRQRHLQIGKQLLERALELFRTHSLQLVLPPRRNRGKGLKSPQNEPSLRNSLTSQRVAENRTIARSSEATTLQLLADLLLALQEFEKALVHATKSVEIFKDLGDHVKVNSLRTLVHKIKMRHSQSVSDLIVFLHSCPLVNSSAGKVEALVDDIGWVSVRKQEEWNAVHGSAGTIPGPLDSPMRHGRGPASASMRFQHVIGSLTNFKSCLSLGSKVLHISYPVLIGRGLGCTDPSSLLLEASFKGEMHRVQARDVGQMMAQEHWSSGIKLVFLNPFVISDLEEGCDCKFDLEESMEAEINTGLLELADIFVATNVPSVICKKIVSEKGHSFDFLRQFYGALFRGDTIRAAFDAEVSHDEFMLLPTDSAHDDRLFANGAPLFLRSPFSPASAAQDPVSPPGLSTHGPSTDKCNLPALPPHFTGRTTLVHYVLSLLERHSVVNLWGNPGVGKSELAAAVGRHVHERTVYSHGVYRVVLCQNSGSETRGEEPTLNEIIGPAPSPVRLRASLPSSATELTKSVADALGLRLNSCSPIELFSCLSDVLLIFDGGEMSRQGPSLQWFVSKLAELPRVRVLITSHLALAVPDLETGTYMALQVQPLSPFDSAKLFFTLIAHNDPTCKSALGSHAGKRRGLLRSTVHALEGDREEDDEEHHIEDLGADDDVRRSPLHFDTLAQRYAAHEFLKKLEGLPARVCTAVAAVSRRIKRHPKSPIHLEDILRSVSRRLEPIEQPEQPDQPLPLQPENHKLGLDPLNTESEFLHSNHNKALAAKRWSDRKKYRNKDFRRKGITPPGEKAEGPSRKWSPWQETDNGPDETEANADQSAPATDIPRGPELIIVSNEDDDPSKSSSPQWEQTKRRGKSQRRPKQEDQLNSSASKGGNRQHKNSRAAVNKSKQAERVGNHKDQKYSMQFIEHQKRFGQGKSGVTDSPSSRRANLSDLREEAQSIKGQLSAYQNGSPSYENLAALQKSVSKITEKLGEETQVRAMPNRKAGFGRGRISEDNKPQTDKLNGGLEKLGATRTRSAGQPINIQNKGKSGLSPRPGYDERKDPGQGGRVTERWSPDDVERQGWSWEDHHAHLYIGGDDKSTSKVTFEPQKEKKRSTSGSGHGPQHPPPQPTKQASLRPSSEQRIAEASRTDANLAVHRGPSVGWLSTAIPIPPPSASVPVTSADRSPAWTAPGSAAVVRQLRSPSTSPSVWGLGRTPPPVFILDGQRASSNNNAVPKEQPKNAQEAQKGSTPPWSRASSCSSTHTGKKDPIPTVKLNNPTRAFNFPPSTDSKASPPKVKPPIDRSRSPSVSSRSSYGSSDSRNRRTHDNTDHAKPPWRQASNRFNAPVGVNQPSKSPLDGDRKLDKPEKNRQSHKEVKPKAESRSSSISTRDEAPKIGPNLSRTSSDASRSERASNEIGEPPNSTASLPSHLLPKPIGFPIATRRRPPLTAQEPKIQEAKSLSRKGRAKRTTHGPTSPG